MSLTSQEFDKIATYENIYRMFITEELRLSDIAFELNCSVDRVITTVKKFNLERKKPIRKFRDRSDDFRKYNFELISEYKGIEYHVLLRCHCGQEFSTVPSKIFNQHTKSCGCLKTKNRCRFTGYEDLSGSHYNSIKRGAEVRKIEFSISKKDVWDQFIKQDRKCALTKLDIQFGNKTKKNTTASVDRIDNTKGYTVDNIQIVHKYINRMKVCHSQDFFIYLCKLVSHNNHEENRFENWEINGLNTINTNPELNQ